MIIQITVDPDNRVKEYSYAPTNFTLSTYNGSLVPDTFDGDIIIWQHWDKPGGWKIKRVPASGITTETILREKLFNEETATFTNWNES